MLLPMSARFVVVLEERDQRRGHRHQLVRRHVHQRDHVVGLGQHEVAVVARRHHAASDKAATHCRPSLAWAMKCLFLERRVELDLVGDRPASTLRYGVSMKPNSFTRA